MKGIICYYSGSGNTKAACETIVRKLTNSDFQLYDIMNGGYPDFDQYGLIGFATFANLLQLPELMAEYLRKIERIAPKYAFIFNTYGSISGNTLAQFRTLLIKKGFIVIDGCSLHTPENYPPMINSGHGFATAPSTNELEKFANFITRLNQNISLIKNSREPKRYQIKIGLINRLLPNPPEFLSKWVMGIKRIDQAICGKCGLCIKLCPYQAITMVEYPEFDAKRCHYCWACYNHCPKGAVHTKSYRSEGRYPKPIKAYLEKLTRI